MYSKEENKLRKFYGERKKTDEDLKKKENISLLKPPIPENSRDSMARAQSVLNKFKRKPNLDELK